MPFLRRVPKHPPGVPAVPSEIWVGGFHLTDGHLMLLCVSRGLSLKDIDLENPLPDANRCLEDCNGGADIIETPVRYGDGSMKDDYLLILRIDTPAVGQEPNVEWLTNQEGMDAVLRSLFKPRYLQCRDSFPNGTLPWMYGKWPANLYVTRHVRRALERSNEIALAKYLAKHATKETSGPAGVAGGGETSIASSSATDDSSFDTVTGSSAFLGDSERHLDDRAESPKQECVVVGESSGCDGAEDKSSHSEEQGLSSEGSSGSPIGESPEGSVASFWTKNSHESATSQEDGAGSHEQECKHSGSDEV